MLKILTAAFITTLLVMSSTIVRGDHSDRHTDSPVQRNSKRISDLNIKSNNLSASIAASDTALRKLITSTAKTLDTKIDDNINHTAVLEALITRKSEEFLKSASDIPKAVLDSDELSIRINDAVTKILGETKQEIKQSVLSELVIMLHNNTEQSED